MSAPIGKKAQEGSKAKRYWTIGIILAVLAAALLIWNSGIFVKNATAATVGDESFKVAELDFYYYSILNRTNSMAKSYAQYGMDSGYDPSVAPEKQYYDEQSQETYADYFKKTALTQLQQVTILCKEADAAGYKISDSGKASIDSTMNQIAMYAAQSGYSQDAYLKHLSGSYMTEKLYLSMLEKTTLASEYAQEKQSKFTYTDAQLNDYYQKNAAELDSYSYRYCHIDAETETTTDASGNQQAATDAETAAAMKIAKSSADAMVAKIKHGTAFNTAAQSYVSESTKASYSDPEYNHKTDALGSELSSYTYGSWLKESGRKTGEVTAIEDGTSGYYVVQFLGREQANDSYQTVDYRNILILADTTPAQDSSSTSSTDQSSTSSDSTAAKPTAEQLAAAKAKAEAILAQWQNGAANDDSFAALAKDNSKDDNTSANGGLNQDAARGSVNSAANDWLFTRGRAVGSSGIVEYTDDDGNVTGYQILLLDKLGQIRWKYQAQSALSSADYDKWYSALEDQYPVKEANGMTHVGT